MATKYKLLAIWGDVEPELQAETWDSFEEVLEAARILRAEDSDDLKSGLYYLKFKDDSVETLEVRAFSGGELEEG